MGTLLVRSATLGLVMLVATGFSDHAADRPNAQKTPIPDAAACEAAESLLRALYRDEYDRAKTPIQKTALARRLLGRAVETEDSPANRFVTLRTARKIAVETGDAHTALEAVEAMAEVFQIDALEMKTESLVQIEKAARSSAQRKELAAIAVRLIDEAATAEHYQAARQLADVALGAARKAHDTDRVRQIVQRRKKLQQSEEKYEAIQKARAVLMEKPADPEANRTVGLYLCFKRGDWKTGLPMLVRGSDEALRAVAQRDLEGGASTQEQVELGDRWWDLAETTEGDDDIAPLRRAGYWYEKARAGLAPSLVKAKVEKRLAEIARIERSALTAQGGDSPSRRLAGVTAEKLVLWNTHNGVHKDRGAVAVNVVLLRRNEVVWQMKGIPIAWSADANPKADVRLPRLLFDVLRVEIVRWVNLGGGLTEIEVYRGEENVAKGRPARASGPFDPMNPIRFLPGMVTDGTTQEVRQYEGYWLLPGAKPGWIEIDLSDVPPEE